MCGSVAQPDRGEVSARLRQGQNDLVKESVGLTEMHRLIICVLKCN